MNYVDRRCFPSIFQGTPTTEDAIKNSAEINSQVDINLSEVYITDYSDNTKVSEIISILSLVNADSYRFIRRPA